MKLRPACALLLSAFLLVESRSLAQQADTALAAQPARQPPAWLTSGVIYEIFPRTFSPGGNLNGVTRRLDDLKNLGVNILWLMPIHPVKSRKKEAWVARMRSATIMPSIPHTAQRTTCGASSKRPTRAR